MVYAGNDYVSAGIQSVLGQNIDLIGTDNQDICLVTSPPLNSIAIPIDQMAKDASGFLIHHLKDKTVRPIHKIYSGIITENKIMKK